jgi:hypothetical protein
LGRTKDNDDIKKVVNEAQAAFNGQEKQEWVDWAGKTLMQRMHTQMELGKWDEDITWQQAVNDEWLRAEEEQIEQKAAEQEVVIIQTLGKLWSRSKESLMQRQKKKQEFLLRSHQTT